MELNDILSINRQPFDYDIRNDDIEDTLVAEVCMEGYIRFLLYLRYLARFMEELNLSMEIPIDSLVMKHQYLKQFPVPGFIMKKSDTNQQLFHEVMKIAEWGVLRLKCEKKGQKIRFSGEDICSGDECALMLQSIPSVLMNSDGTYTEANINLCWNYKLARYLRFRERYREKIDASFQEADQQIELILSLISDPFCSGTGDIFCGLTEDRYVIGFHEGGSYGQAFSYQTLDYHFCINIAVLSLLISHALELFNLDMEEEYGA